MDRFKGFTPGKKDSVTKRAAHALIWLLKRSTDETKAYVSWTELYCAVAGKRTSTIDPAEVKEQLRSRGGQVKIFMREMGYGWWCHEADRSLIRACTHGADSAQCVQWYARRASRASENVVTWADKTMGNLKHIIRNKSNREMIDSLQSRVEELRSISDHAENAEIERPAKRRAAA